MDARRFISTTARAVAYCAADKARPRRLTTKALDCRLFPFVLIPQGEDWE